MNGGNCCHFLPQSKRPFHRKNVYLLHNYKCYIVEQKELISQLQQRLGKSRSEMEHMLDGFCALVTERCAQMDSIMIQGLGTFEARKKMERVSVNPSTGKRMLIPPKITLVFKPNSAIKNRLKERS